MATLEDEAAQHTSALGPLVGLTREDIFGAVAVLLRETASNPQRLMKHSQAMGGARKIGERQMQTAGPCPRSLRIGTMLISRRIDD